MDCRHRVDDARHELVTVALHIRRPNVVMVTVEFTPNLRRHLDLNASAVSGATVRDILDAVFAQNPRLAGYVLDDQRALRKHVNVFVDGTAVVDRTQLRDVVGDASTVFIVQALSGG